MKVYIIFKLINNEYVLKDITSSISKDKVMKFIKQKEVNKKLIDDYKNNIDNKFYLDIIDKEIFDKFKSLEIIEVNFVNGVINEVEINITKDMLE